jgi:hypothetical protein
MAEIFINVRLESIPTYIQEQLNNRGDYVRAYVLIPGKWAEVGGYQVMLAKVAQHRKEPSKLLVKYPELEKGSWIKNLFWFLQKGVWVYDFCRIPFTNMVVWKKDGNQASESSFLAAFIPKD